MHWYFVIKTIKGRRYRYRQKTRREGKQVRTKCEYISPEVIIGYHGTFAKFERFSEERLGTANDSDSSQEGFFFASHPKVAASYASTFLARQRGVETTIRTIEERIKSLTGERWHTARTRLENGAYAGDLANKLSHYLRMHERANEKLRDRTITKVTLSKRGEVKECILDLKNPYVYNMNGRYYNDREFCDAAYRAKEKGHDGVIIRKTYDAGSCDRDVPITDVYIVFDAGQIRPFDPTPTLGSNVEEGK
jgi:ADP-Ribosyltransferase in polyvalent proteins